MVVRQFGSLGGATVGLGDRRYLVDVEVEDVTGKHTQTGLATVSMLWSFVMCMMGIVHVSDE